MSHCGYYNIPMSNITPNSAAEPAPELPLAPPIVPHIKTPAEARLETRIWCSFIFAICASMLAFALYLKPDPLHTGTGTHQQLGFPPCGFLQSTGFPCPTCGCTTAVTWFAHASPLKSFLTQPFGFAVAFLATLLVPLSFWGLATGRWVGPSTFVLAWHWRYWTYGSILILLTAWVYKIAIIKMNIVF
jgi:hypothetical protein